MNTEELESLVEDIFNTYEPMSQLNEHLFNNHDSSEFKKITNEKIKDLPAPIKERIQSEIFGWGPLNSLKDKDDVFDIIVNGPHSIHYETSQGLHKLDDQFLSLQSYQNFTEEIFKKANILISQKEPFANGRIGPFRIHVTIPPVSSQVHLTLRRHRTKTIPLEELAEDHFFTKGQYDLVKSIIALEKNFLVIGPTGSGKTTFLNSIIHSLTNRLVIIEDTDELKVNGPVSTKLLSREVCPDNLNVITMENLLKQALRMRPDRIIVGEVRGEEAKDLLQALATGHSGSIGTLHAQSAQQAIYRLEMLIQMGAPQWDLQSIRRLIQISLDYLIVLNEDRYKKGIEGIYKIESMEKFGLLLNKEC